MMRKLWTAFIVLVLILSLMVLTVQAQEATTEPTAEATAALEAPTAEATAVLEPIPPTEAPAENPDNAEGAPTGLSTLVLLMGLGAVSLVGLAMLARDNVQKPSGDKS